VCVCECVRVRAHLRNSWQLSHMLKAATADRMLIPTCQGRAGHEQVTTRKAWVCGAHHCGFVGLVNRPVDGGERSLAERVLQLEPLRGIGLSLARALLSGGVESARKWV
jgi:hypothetical protein